MLKLESMRQYVRHKTKKLGHLLTRFTTVNRNAGAQLRSFAICKNCAQMVEVDTVLGVLGEAHLNKCRKGFRVVS